MTEPRPVDAIEGAKSDLELISEVLNGSVESFEPLIQRYSPRLFATARRYARRETEVEDIVQEVWSKAFQKLGTWRGDAPFEHWLMRMAVHTCYDFLRVHQRNREDNFSDITREEEDWLERFKSDGEVRQDNADAARLLVERILRDMSPASRMIITLLEIEDKSIKEISAITGWSTPLVKVRAFRARAEMKKRLRRIMKDKYL